MKPFQSPPDALLGVLAFASALQLAPGIARAQYSYTGYGFGTLQVLNQTPELLNCSVDGRPVGAAAPHQVSTFPNILAGYKSILCTNAFGQVRSSGRFFLPMMGTYTWRVFSAYVYTVPVVPAPGYTGWSAPTAPAYGAPVVPGAAAPYGVPAPAYGAAPGGPAGYPSTPPAGYPQTTAMPSALQPSVPAQPTGGSVQVHNRFPHAANVSIAGRDQGSLEPGRTAVYQNLPPGTHTLIATRRDTGQELHRQSVTVAAGGRVYVTLNPPVGRVRVVNSRSELVQVFVDGASSGTAVPANGTVEIPDVQPGTRKLVAKAGDAEIQSTDAAVYAGQVYTWYIRSAVGAVRIFNATSERVTLTIDGEPKGSLAPNEQRFFPNLPVGVRKLAAASPTGVKGTENLQLNPGEIRMWMIK